MKTQPSLKVILLGVAVITVWVMVINNINKYIASQETIPFSETNVDFRSKPLFESNDSLTLTYPDPFLKANKKKSDNDIKKSSPIIRQHPLPKDNKVVTPQQDLTTIVYQGTHSNNSSKIHFAVLLVHGQEFIVSKNDQVEGFRVFEIRKDSICLKGDSQFIWIKRRIF